MDPVDIPHVPMPHQYTDVGQHVRAKLKPSSGTILFCLTKLVINAGMCTTLMGTHNALGDISGAKHPPPAAKDGLSLQPTTDTLTLPSMTTGTCGRQHDKHSFSGTAPVPHI